MDMLNSPSDPYDRKARLAPALLCALPLFVSLLLLVPEVGALWGAVGGLVLYCGGAKFLTQVGRDRGKVLEPTLYASWGGKPSVAMLRHSDSRLKRAHKEPLSGIPATCRARTGAGVTRGGEAPS